jgi:outer membrane receptor protein involved in Fe transport
VHRSATGTKIGTPLLVTPQLVSAVTRDRIEQQDARRLNRGDTLTPV